MDFCSLQHIKVWKSTCRAVSKPRYVPSSGFGYPLDGLLLPNPRRPCFVPTALLGFTLRSFLLLQGIRDVSIRMNPPAVSASGIAAAEATARSKLVSAPGLLPLPRVPCEADVCLARRSPDAPLGFRPFQGFHTTALIEIPPDLLSHASPIPLPKEQVWPASQSINRLSLGLIHPRRRIGGDGQGSPHRVFAPLHS